MADATENAIALTALEARIISLEKDADRNSKQHSEFYAKFTAIAVAEGKRDTTLGQMSVTLQEIKDDVKSLKDKPTRRWELITNEAVKWGTLLVLAMLAAQMGLTG